MINTEFEQFIKINKDRMYRFAFSILRNHEDAKDVVQEVVLKLWKQKARLDKSNNVKSFYMSAIKNNAMDVLRKKRLETGFRTSLEKKNTENQNFENIDLLDKLKDELKKLPVQQRMAVELKDFQGYEYEEISRILNSNINAVRVNVSRGRKKLYEVFREELK